LKKINVFTDGASRGNPGLAAIGVVITDETGTEIKTFKKFLGEFTNNFAEYTGLIESVKLLKDLNLEFDELNFFCDSELVVKQVKGLYNIKHKDLINLSLEFWKEIKSLNKKFTITHIPREQNKTADRLANEALDENQNSYIDRSLLLNS
jgi:ribonuclease HI